MEKCSSTKSAHIVCKPCACKHSSKLANTVLATYIHSPTQACAYFASCVHASTHSTLRILCKLCTCIHPLNPAHTLQAVYIHPPTQPCAYSASCVHASTHSSPRILCKLCTFRPRMQICMQVCMRAQHAKFACTGRDMHAHAEHTCRECCMQSLLLEPSGLHALSSCRFACVYMHAKNNALLY